MLATSELLFPCRGSVALPFPASTGSLTLTPSIYDSAGNKLSLPPVTASLIHHEPGQCPGSCAWRAGPHRGISRAWMGLALVGLMRLSRCRVRPGRSCKSTLFEGGE